VQTLIANASEPKASTWATVIGVATLLYAAFNLLTQLRISLQAIWRLDELPKHGLWEYVKGYVFAFIAMPCVGLFLMASLAASTILTTAIKEWGDDIYGGPKTWRFVEIGASILLVTLLFALIFRLLSDRRIPWGDLWGGAFFGAVLFTFGKTLIAMYLGYTSTASAFGAAGSLVVFLIWVYYSAQIVFIGAAIVPVRVTER
jgi:membrane protein